MSVLNEEQEEFLRQVGSRGYVFQERDRDSLAMIGIEVATCLSTYQIGGDQFAAVVMDLIASLTRLVIIGDPDLAAQAGVTRFVTGATHLSAMAFNQYEEAQRGSQTSS